MEHPFERSLQNPVPNLLKNDTEEPIIQILDKTRNQDAADVSKLQIRHENSIHK